MTRWKRTFLAVCLAQVCSITGFAGVVPFLPFFIRDLGITDPAAVARWAGVVASAAAVTMGLFGPLWGWLADRYGRKLMVVRSMFGGVLVLSLMSLSRNVYQLVVCRLLQGALTGTMTASTALVAAVAPRNQAGYALGVMQAAMFLGQSLGPLVAGVASDHFGYRTAFRGSAGLLLLGAVVVMLFAEEPRHPPTREAGKQAEGKARRWVSAGFLTACAALFVIRFAHSMALPVYPLYVEYLRGSGAAGINTITGGIVASGGLAAALSAGLLGKWGDRQGHDRLLIGACLFSGAVAGLHVGAWALWHLLVLRILFGMGAAGLMPAANAMIRNSIDEGDIGKAYGIAAAVTSIGWAFGPLTAGWLAAEVGLRAPFAAMGLALLTSGGLAWFGRRRWRAPEGPSRTGEPSA